MSTTGIVRPTQSAWYLLVPASSVDHSHPSPVNLSLYPTHPVQGFTPEILQRTGNLYGLLPRSAVCSSALLPPDRKRSTNRPEYSRLIEQTTMYATVDVHDSNFWMSARSPGRPWSQLSSLCIPDSSTTSAILKTNMAEYMTQAIQ